MKMQYLSLFSGIGGFEKGIEDATKRKKKFQNVSDSLKSTSTQSKSTGNTSPVTRISETSQPSTKKIYPTLTSLLEGFLAKHFPLLENVEASVIQEARFSLISLGLSGKNNHAFYCLKTSKGFYLTTKAAPSTQSSPRLMSWGTTVNGKCLTAKITESPRTESGSSLSDILEEQVDRRYFLSEKAIAGILKHKANHRAKGNGFGATLHQL